MNKFEELGLKPEILKAIIELGYETPTPVQEQAIPAIINDAKDIVALAQTGTGKTAAFGLPLIHKIDFKSRQTQALILCPTRELCLQITKDLQSYAKYIEHANIVAIYGGAAISNQLRDVKRGAQIVVGTPGRMVDMITRKGINLSTINFVVLDEADEMLNMGFKEDLDDILSETPPEKATCLFSATMPKEVERIARNYMNEPLTITVGKRNQGASNIEHVYYVVHARDRYNALKRIVDFHPDIFGIIFCRTKIETQEVADKLIRDGYSADSLHGDLSQQQRDMVMKRFRNHQVQMLVATDVAARGIDVDDVTHVINYNLPDEIENYTHRSGRTARAGKSGISVVILNIKEVYRVRDIERIVGKQFTKMKIPNGVEVCEKQLFNLVEKIHDVEVDEAEMAQYLPKILEQLADVSKEDLIKRFVTDEFKRFLTYYKNAPDLNVENRNMDRDRERGSVDKDGKKHSRFFISVGLMDGLDKGSLLRFVCDTTNLEGSNIGRIELKHSFSFFEVESELEDILLTAFKEVTYRGRKVNVELSTMRNSGSDDGGGERKRFSREGKGRGYGGGGGGGYNKREGGGGYKKREGGGGYNKREGGFKKRDGEGGGYKKREESNGNYIKKESTPYSDREKSNSGNSDRESSGSGERRKRFFKKRD